MRFRRTAMAGDTSLARAMSPLRRGLGLLVIAVLGGAASLLIGYALGWVHRNGGTETVVVTSAVVAPPQVIRVVSSEGGAFHPEDIYATKAPAVVTVYAQLLTKSGVSIQQGSGFAVDREGTIATSAHVVTNAGSSAKTQAATQTYVEFSNGDRLTAKLLGWDLSSDVAVLHVDPTQHELTPLAMAKSQRLVVGQPVAIIGSPFGVQGSLVVGVVSALGHSIPSITSRYDVPDAIQLDAPLNHGDSGGPVLNAAGKVIGIVAQVRVDPGSTPTLGYAIPARVVRRSVTDLAEYGHVRYAYVGVTTEDMTPALAHILGYPPVRGALIDTVDARSAAGRAHLRPGSKSLIIAGQQVTTGGDVIVSIAGARVRGANDVARIVAGQLRPNQVAVFTIIRRGHRMIVPVRLGVRPGSSG
ncbi:MAG: S1C family serine protease [Gaiellaceae bacterium]